MRDFAIAAVVALAVVLGVAVVASRFPAGSPTPAPPAVTTPQEAAAIALAQDPRFAGIGPLDPDLIGQGSWWEAAPTADGFAVTIQIGWDDCQAGCINRHTWLYLVRSDGSAELLKEEGPPVPAP